VGVVIWEWKDTLLLGKPSNLPVAEVCKVLNVRNSRN
jgi:hypothetical protein